MQEGNWDPLSCSPLHFQLSMTVHTVQKIKVDQALVRNVRVFRHLLEVFDDLRLKAKCYLLLELFGIRIFPGLHL